MRITRRFSRPVRGDRGLTIVEVMVALALLSIGILAIVGVFPQSTAGVDRGKQETVATFLAEQRMEQLRSVPFNNLPALNGQVEAYGTIPNAPGYRRTVTVTDCTGAFNCPPSVKLLQVSVFYRPVIVIGNANPEREIRLYTLMANHL